MDAKLSYVYDEQCDVMCIEGIKYSGELFRSFANGLPVNVPFKIVARKDGVLIVQRLRSEHNE